ncbi:integrin alpha-D-like [Hyla sarda]|uniref:integrin alpha-D-like n=1 Tax=Hyla sarda TaxID=327740 RepID=UPI0024C2D363|nr:integrin alpha-D-like [Hyla sarda]
MAVWLCWSLKMAAGLCWFPLFLVLTQASASFLDTKQPIIFRDSDRSFGHQVAQLGQRLIVSAPRYQVAANKTGRIYGCDPRTTNCSPIPITGSEDEIDISLGLSLAARENPGQILVCGPTLQKPCGQNVYVNGRCYQLDQSLNVQKSLSAPPPECGLDVVFVIDGSASVGSYNFELMLNFVKQMISSLSNTDTQFAVLQYSHYITAQFKFRRFPSSSDLNTVRNIKFQDGYATKTPTAILSAVEKLFIPLSRKDSRKLLIVITDGLSNDRDVRFSDATLLAKSFGIQRISIGVGSAFSSGVAKRELDIIASSPDNVFQVNDFSALDKILKSLQEKIFAIEGTQSLSGQSFELEFSQEGFSAVLTSHSGLQLVPHRLKGLDKEVSMSHVSDIEETASLPDNVDQQSEHSILSLRAWTILKVTAELHRRYIPYSAAELFRLLAGPSQETAPPDTIQTSLSQLHVMLNSMSSSNSRIESRLEAVENRDTPTPASQANPTPSTAQTSMPVAANKVEGPSTEIASLGLRLDTVKMQASLPQDKLHRIGAPDQDSTVRLGKEALADLAMWERFLSQWNGILLFTPKAAQQSPCVHTDVAFNTGFVAIYRSLWMANAWLEEVVSLPGFKQVSSLSEIYPVVAAAQVWGREWTNTMVIFLIDNADIADFLTSGRPTSKEIMSFARRFMWLSLI